MGFRIDAGLKEFIESGVAVIVGSGSPSGRPQVAYGWGPRVEPDLGMVEVFLDTARADPMLENLRAIGRIAMTVADPVSYRSVQLKGSFVDSGEATPDDYAWVQRHRDAFLTTTSLIGDPPEAVMNLWMDEVTRVSFTVERAFNQTPGPDAGQPL